QDTLFLDYHPDSKSGVVRFEAYLQGGDSGAPLFIERNGKLLLLGTNSLIVTNGSGQVVSSGVAYVGNQAGFIWKFTNASAVPEPTASWLLATLAGFILTRTRRRIT
ncbi:MAG: PEP-CTERM sorting domain-containing protein, partial [Planctomycetota bacterium]